MNKQIAEDLKKHFIYVRYCQRANNKECLSVKSKLEFIDKYNCLIASCSDIQQEIITKRFRDNESWTRIAMQVNWSEKTCQRYLNKAFKQMLDLQ